jgi:LmbE family N-acetylglucosaminyl deacetylase
MPIPDAVHHKPRLRMVRRSQEDRLHILVVTTEDDVSAVLKHDFAAISGATPTFAPDVETAIRMLAAEHYDVVAIDPAVTPNGFELLTHVKDNYRWIATLLASHEQDPQFLRRAVKCRIDGLLFRPVGSHEFVEQAMLLAKAVSANRQRQQLRVLAVGAHPDDVEIGCGGALAKHHANGDILQILTLSRGAAGGDVNVRAVEAHHAAELLGASLQMGDLRDTHITEGTPTIGIIEDVIRELRPTHVYTHCAEDTHQDHRAVHAASLVAARGVPNLYCYQSPSSTVEFQPNRFVDITDFIKVKIQAIDSYRSQVARMDALQHDVILSTARYWGRYAGYVLAEPLSVVRQRDSDTVPGKSGEALAADSPQAAAD